MPRARVLATWRPDLAPAEPPPWQETMPSPEMESLHASVAQAGSLKSRGVWGSSLPDHELRSALKIQESL